MGFFISFISDQTSRIINPRNEINSVNWQVVHRSFLISPFHFIDANAFVHNIVLLNVRNNLMKPQREQFRRAEQKNCANQIVIIIELRSGKCRQHKTNVRHQNEVKTAKFFVRWIGVTHIAHVNRTWFFVVDFFSSSIHSFSSLWHTNLSNYINRIKLRVLTVRRRLFFSTAIARTLEQLKLNFRNKW